MKTITMSKTKPTLSDITTDDFSDPKFPTGFFTFMLILVIFLIFRSRNRRRNRDRNGPQPSATTQTKQPQPSARKSRETPTDEEVKHLKDIIDFLSPKVLKHVEKLIAASGRRNNLTDNPGEDSTRGARGNFPKLSQEVLRALDQAVEDGHLRRHELDKVYDLFEKEGSSGEDRGVNARMYRRSGRVTI